MGGSGECDPRFKEVAEEFERNFAERGEVGASVCVIHEGEKVVDLWGGSSDLDSNRPWEEDTISVVASATKGATALAAHLLIARGEIDLEAPVADYWPEYGAAGKQDVTVSWLLSHLDGMPVLERTVPPGGQLDWEYMVAAIAAEAPRWQPGTRAAYHPHTFGFGVGELVRRVSGRSVGRYFREELAEPLGIDFWIGLPESHDHRVAHSIAADPPSQGDAPVVEASLPGGAYDDKVAANSGGMLGAQLSNTPEAHRAELPSTGGITNGRGLAGLYAPLAHAGSWNGATLFTKTDIARMSAPRAAGIDPTLHVHLVYALGFWRSADSRWRRRGPTDSMVLSTEAFGHSGNGGRIGFADPVGRFSFGYTNNKMAGTGFLDERGQSLVDATYRALGYVGGEITHWSR